MAAESKIQDLEPVEQIQDTDNIPLENGGKAKRITGSKLIRYLIRAADHLGLLGIHVGSDQPAETQNVWVEEVDEYTIPDDAYASWDIRYEKLGLLNDKITSAVNGWSSQKISDLLSKKADTTAVPKVPAWAMEPKKPSYTASEVGALPAGTKIPSKTSDLKNDSGYTTVEEAQKVYNGLYANALTRTVQGEVIAVDDVSPLEHSVGCKVSSKNMTTAIQVYKKANNYALVTKDGRNAVTFTSGSTQKSSFTDFKPNTQYTVSFEEKVVNGAGGTSLFAFFYTDGTYSNLVKGSSDWEKATLTSTPGKTVSGIGVSSYNYRETNYIDIDTFQLKEGVKATPYVPYIPDLPAVAIKRIGSNCYEMGTKADYSSKDGADIEIVGNSITGSSVPSAMGFIIKETFFEPGTFHLSAVFEKNCAFIVRCFDEGGNLLSGSDVSLPEGIYNNYYKGWKMSGASIAIKFPSKVKKWKLGFVFTGGTAYERLTIRDIMVNTGSEVLPFAPYQEQTYTPSSSGAVSGMTSLSPNMTVLTDTPGAVVELTYNQDPTIVIKKLTDRVSELENTRVKEAL